MTATVKAADLPEGSVVASSGKNAWIKTHTEDGCWYRTGSDDNYWTSEIQSELDAGAQVLRIGYGDE